MAGLLMWIGFRDLYLKINTDETAKRNFIIHSIVAERAGSSPGQYLYPGNSVFLQLSIDHLAYPMVDKYLADERAKAKRRGNRY